MDGYYSNPESCSSFYLCIDRNPYLMVYLNLYHIRLTSTYKCTNFHLNIQNCPVDIDGVQLVYNPANLRCDKPSNVPSCQAIMKQIDPVL